MRFKLYFNLENQELPIQYRKSILSFFKLSLSEYNLEAYKKFYNERDTIIKGYTFSTYFKNMKIDNDKVIVEGQCFNLTVSVQNYEDAIILYNAFNHQRNKKFSLYRNSWVLKDIEIVPEKRIEEDSVTIKFLSPLCARSRKDYKDYYFSYADDEFEDTVKVNIKEQLKITDFPEMIVDTFKITPINAKKIVVKYYEKQIECSTGIFKIRGDRELLEYLYKAGMGSNHSAGFGMFQIIQWIGGVNLKVKVYLGEWFYNAGIIGFLRILDKNQINIVEKKDNYIEFDTDDLRDFDKYYFKYFFDRYDVAKNVRERTENSFNYLLENIEKIDDKVVKDAVKSNKKYIKDAIKKQLDKIKKIDVQVYDDMKYAYDKLDKEDSRDGIEQIRKVLLDGIENEIINKRLTLNLFKSILSNTYYGQPSFLNVVKTALSYEEQQEVMYIDYVSNIVETGFLHDIIDGKYELESLKNELCNRLESKRVTKDFEKVYEKIKKAYIDKGKNIDEIKSYLQESVLQHCCMCENDFGLTSNYSESSFVPLAISNDNARNFFWNQNVKFPICDVCKLILFCIPAGVSNIRKVVKDNGEYKEKPVINFVNYDTCVEDLLKINNNFQNNSRYENRAKNVFAQMILDIVGQESKVSKWQLQNVFVVEFDTEYGAYSRIEYFNIRKYVAEFFKDYSKRSLSRMRDYRYKMQVVDFILKNKDMKYVINDRLKMVMTSQNAENIAVDSFFVSMARSILSVLKKEDDVMEKREQVKKNTAKLYTLYNLGVEMHMDLVRDNKENKINGYVYKMLNSIKTGNVGDFMDVVVRIHTDLKKDVPIAFMDAMSEEGLDFEAVGHSFLSGLISNRYQNKNDKETDNDEK